QPIPSIRPPHKRGWHQERQQGKGLDVRAVPPPGIGHEQHQKQENTDSQERSPAGWLLAALLGDHRRVPSEAMARNKLTTSSTNKKFTECSTFPPAPSK